MLKSETRSLASLAFSIPLTRYNYKSDHLKQPQLGFILEDVENKAPFLLHGQDQVNLYGYSSLAIAAVQELKAEIEMLKLELAALKNKK